MLKDFESLLALTKDERFVTARQCLQSLWKIGLAGKKQQSMLIDGLAKQYDECVVEKNYALIRYDILDDLRKLEYEQQGVIIEKVVIALWGAQVENRPEALNSLQALRVTGKVEIPKE
jgi:hypothetical protein